MLVAPVHVAAHVDAVGQAGEHSPQRPPHVVDALAVVLRAEAASTEFRQLANPKINRKGLSFAFIDESYSVGQLVRFFHVVGGQDDSDSAIRFLTDNAADRAYVILQPAIYWDAPE